jgi:hypothetical protein
MDKTLRQFCLMVIAELGVAGEGYGYTYVQYSMELYRAFKYIPELKIGLFSSLHGPDFFEVIVRCLDGETWGEKGAYATNFRRFIEFYREREALAVRNPVPPS